MIGFGNGLFRPILRSFYKRESRGPSFGWQSGLSRGLTAFTKQQ